MTRRLLLLAVSTLLILTGLPWIPPGAAGAEPRVSGPGTVLVVMDTSGSMSATTDGGKTRLEEARDAVLKTADSLPTGARFGLIAYPGNGRVEDGCSIGDEEIKLGPLEAGSVSTAVRRLTANGDTPTGPALKHAADILKKEGGHGTIIVVSDGDANCGSSNLCEVAEAISKEGMAVHAHTVGFHHDDDQLACVARTLGGKHVNVTDPGALEPVLEELSGARLEFDLEVPKEMPEVAGVGTQGSTIVAKVRSTGQQPANNVRVSIEVKDSHGNPGKLIVPKAVRMLGNLDPKGKERQVAMTIRPPEGSVGQYTVVATVYSVNTSPVRRDGSFHVVKSGPISGVLGRAKNVAVLGDSFSSGEGARNYVRGTDDDMNHCHRSSSNYGSVLFPKATYTIACSGAVIQDLYGQQAVGESKDGTPTYETPQLKRLRTLSTTTDVDAVLMSLGGNDLMFGTVLGECLDFVNGDAGRCQMYLDIAIAYSKTADFTTRLAAAYLDVDNTVNDPVARTVRGGSTAPIVVVPYPRLTPTTEQIMSGKTTDAKGDQCILGAGRDTLVRFNELTDAANAAVSRSVTSVQSLGRPVYYALPVVEAFQPNHTICDDGPYSNKDLLWKAATGNKVELAHPNASGHRAMASAISVWSQVARPVDAAGRGPVLAPNWERTTSKITEPNAVDNISALLMWPVKNTDLIGPMSVQKRVYSGYAPGGAVTVEIRSTPQMVGVYHADQNGNVTAEFRVPANLSTGKHTIVVKGFTPDGTPKEDRAEVLVIPRYSGLMALIFLAGVVLAFGGAISIRRAKKRSTRQAGAVAR